VVAEERKSQFLPDFWLKKETFKPLSDKQEIISNLNCHGERKYQNYLSFK
jgi:hypothetical protein